MRNMFLRLMLFLGAILGTASITATAAHASDRHRFLVGYTSPAQIADAIAAANKRDPTGRTVIDPISCSRYRACATAEDFLDMVDRSAPGAHLTEVSQLPDFFRRLVIAPAPAGQYWMACRTGAGGGDTAVWNCMTRSFHTGETVYVDPVTGAMVLARDCSNPVGREQREAECIELHVALREGDELHVGWLSPDRSGAFPSGKCTLSVQKTGEQERSGYVMDECPRDQCDFSGPARDLHMLVWDRPRISWRAYKEGDNVIRLPREVLESDGVLVLCVVRPDERMRQTLGVVVNRHSYRFDRYYVTYDGLDTITNWNGTPTPWRFTDGRNN